MFKRMMALMLALALCFTLFTACGKKEATTEGDTSAEVTEVPESEAYLDNNDRPIAVMIDNDGSSSWPHSGLEDAYLIYEMYVEGGATRLMALFKGADTEKIGPVRSCRHYFLDYALENDAIYTAYGWSPLGQADSKNLKADYINGIAGADGTDYFWRDRKYAGDYHSAYTSIKKILTACEKKGYRTTSEDRFQNYNSEIKPLDGGESAVKFKIPYSGMYSVTYTFDAENHRYTRTLNKSTLHQSKDGTPFAPVNIIIMEVPSYGLGDADNPARRQFDTVGSGKGYLITEGTRIPITWEKSARTAKTVYKDENGNALTLNPGQTFINLVNPGTAISFE